MKQFFLAFVGGLLAIGLILWFQQLGRIEGAQPEPVHAVPKYTDLYLKTLPDGTRCVVAESSRAIALACDFPYLEPK